MSAQDFLKSLSLQQLAPAQVQPPPLFQKPSHQQLVQHAMAQQPVFQPPTGAIVPYKKQTPLSPLVDKMKTEFEARVASFLRNAPCLKKNELSSFQEEARKLNTLYGELCFLERVQSRIIEGHDYSSHIEQLFLLTLLQLFPDTVFDADKDGYVWQDSLLSAQHIVEGWENSPIDFSVCGPRGLQIAIECDGFENHYSTPQKVAFDQRKDQHLFLEGWIVVRFLGISINADPEYCVRYISALVERRRK